MARFLLSLSLSLSLSLLTPLYNRHFLPARRTALKAYIALKEWIDATLTLFARNDMRLFSCHYEEREARSIVIASGRSPRGNLSLLFLSSILVALLALVPVTALANSGGTAGVPAINDFSGNNGTASNNTVVVDTATVTGSVYGGYDVGSANVTNNNVTISQSVWGGVYGGFTGIGDATGNNVTITGGTVTGSVYGSFINTSGDATGNNVTITGGTVTGDVYGGFNMGSGTATNNTVNISGAPVLTGVTLRGGVGAGSSGNTLNIHSAGLTAKNISGFQHLRFYLPASIVAGATMLTLTDANVNISATDVGVGIVGGGTPLALGDTVTLIKAGTTLTPPTNMKNTTTGMSGISTVYEFNLETTADSLIARVAGSKPTDEAIRKSPAEGKAASVTLVTQGADLIAGKGMSSAREAARAIGVGAGGLGVAGFGAVNGGTSTYKTGSHVDVTGFSLMAGLAKRLHLTGVDALAGVFFEAGWGSYNSYNDGPNGTEIKGWGNSRYYGGGIMGRLEWTEGLVKGLYTEASVRLGGLHSDYKSDDLNPVGRASYETNATYYGAHMGLGYIWEFNEKASLTSTANTFGPTPLATACVFWVTR